MTVIRRLSVPVALAGILLAGPGPSERSSGPATGSLLSAVRAAEPAATTDGPDERVIRRLRELLPDMPDDKVRWLADQFGNTAINIAREHGPRGAEVVILLGAQGVAVMRQNPVVFKEVSQHFSGEMSAVYLVFLHKHFDEIARWGGLPRLLDLIEKMPEDAKDIGRKYPAALPFLAIAPAEVTAALMHQPEVCLLCLPAVDLSAGPEGLKKVAVAIKVHGARARPWIDVRGLDGLFLTESFPTLVEKHVALPRGVFLQVLNDNQVDVLRLMEAGKEKEVVAAFNLLHAAAEKLPEKPLAAGRPHRGGLLNLGCTDPHTIRFLVERGNRGMQMILATWEETYQTGVTLPDLLYRGYGPPEEEEKLHQNAWQAFEHSKTDWEQRQTFRMLVQMLDYDGQNPATRHERAPLFRARLKELDYRVVRYLAEAEQSADAGVRTDKYFTLKDRGVDALEDWERTGTSLVELLPLYDTIHLGWILAQGYTPTQGEVLFAGIDAAFTVWDLATLGAGKAATTAAKGGLKAGGKGFREGAEALGKAIAKEAVEKGAEMTGKQATDMLLMRMAKSAAVVTQVAAKKLWSHLEVAVEYAAKSAAIRRIPLVTLRYAVREWTINFGVSKSLEQAAQLAAKSDNALWAAKTKEVLSYLSRLQTTPIGGVR